jgi:hypothetical protein
VNIARLGLDGCVLQANSFVAQMQSLICRSTDRDCQRVDNPVVVLDATCRIPGDETHEVFHDITSKGTR